ncbi:MAG: hypothetical protein IPJ78_18995 [Gemmatimonadetes bacterium]|nr:hypothetical protein [Gemmatimonadota bacterium]
MAIEFRGWCSRLHVGQLAIIWIVLVVLAASAWFTLPLVHEWRVAVHEEQVERFSDNLSACRARIVATIPLGEIAEKLGQFDPPSKFIERASMRPPVFWDSIRVANTNSRDSMLTELGPRAEAVMLARAAIDSQVGVCIDESYVGEEPSVKPFESAFLLIAASCLAFGLIVSWFWFGRRG